jgi:CRP-like cAMP-binding protein
MMISPELLLRYPFFGSLSDAQLKAIAMLSQERYCTEGDAIFQAGESADQFYFLLQGGIHLHFSVSTSQTPDAIKNYYVGHINPGEPFGISGLIEPYRYTASAIAASSGHFLIIETIALRALCEADAKLSAVLMHQVAKAAFSRLNETRVQLAATQG